MNVDPEWNLETAFVELSYRHPPGSLIHGRTRNLMLQVWGELVGRSRALAELEALIRNCGSRTALCRKFRISRPSLGELEEYFEGLPLESNPGHWSSGTRLGPWTLLRRLGRGGGSEVWRSSSERFGEVALKIPDVGTAKRKRFAAEIQILRQLAGVKGIMPVIATSIDADQEAQATPWLAMPIAIHIADEVARRNNPTFVIRGIASMAATLATFHARGVSHRDIKPANIYWLKRSWVLADFGIASFPGKAAMTKNGRKLGPAYFIAPEMLNSPETSEGAPADVYSLAKTLWVLLSGQSFPPPGEQRVAVEALRVSSYVKIANVDRLDVLMDECTRHAPIERPLASVMADCLAAVI